MATFAELTAKVANWSNRSDLTAQIPDFLEIAQKRVNSILRIAPMETIVMYTGIIADQTTLAIPSDLIEVISIRTINDNNETIILFDNKVDSRSFDKTPPPNSFTRRAGDFVLSEKLIVDSKVVLYYYRVLPKLNAVYPDTTSNKGLELPADQASITEGEVTVTATEASCTTAGGTFSSGTCDAISYPDSVVGDEVPQWFRDEAEFLLLYGALVEVANFLNDADDALRWEDKFQEKIAEIKGDEFKREQAGGTIVQNIITYGLI